MSIETYTSPNGDTIIGTAERIFATALISGIDPDTQRPEYSGGSDIHWDTQVTLTRGGQTIFVCEAGEEWTFDQLVKVTLNPRR